MIKKRFYDKTFKICFDLVLNCERDELIEIIHKDSKICPHIIDEGVGYMNAGEFVQLIKPDTGEAWYYVWLSKYDGSIQDQSILVHELFHLTSNALNNLQIPHDINKSEEIYAYYLSFVYEEVFTFLSKNVNKTQ